MNKTGNVLAVIGGQYGSEGKGVIVSKIADRYQHHVRVGGPNAGHSINYKGRVWKMQQLPCGWINPEATLWIGPGAVLDANILEREIMAVHEAHPELKIKGRVHVSAQAALLDDRHHNIEGGVDGELHQRIGSTGEGVGAAREARMSRDKKRIDLAETLYNTWGERHFDICQDVPLLLSKVRLAGEDILLEGTQGSGLSLIHGPWPYVTSADTNAGQLAVDAGIPPHHVTQVLMVVRSHPIRVAGNSGPLKGETTWEAISERLGRDVIERTTVTHKVRRVGEWDQDLVEKAVILNAPTSFALTFADYIDPADEGKTHFDDLGPETRGFVEYLESYFEVPVSLIGTGGKDDWHVIDRGIAL